MSTRSNIALGLACVVLALRAAVPDFERAQSVWPAGLESEMNTLVGFTAPFDAVPGTKVNLKLVAWYSYRVTLNGKFVAFGPARGPKGFFRADELELTGLVAPGRNELMVEVAGYNVPSYYLVNQAPFFKAELAVGKQVVAASGVKGAFAARRLPRVQKSPRYSFQRTFAEHYRLGASPTPQLALAAAPEPELIDRITPYPDYETWPLSPLSFAQVKVDDSKPVRSGRALTYPGKRAWFKGYTMENLELNTSHLAQRLVYSQRRDATQAEKAAGRFSLGAGESMVLDRALNDTGFPGATVEVKKPGRLVLTFDEVLTGSEVRGAERYGDCCNIIVWDFERPGTYAISAFEPYVMRYLDFGVLSGEMTLSDLHFRSYKNATAKRARFSASDPVLERIFAAAAETFRQNAVDVFMDCPSRERAGWNCDAYFTAPASTLLTGNTDLERVFEETLALPSAFAGLPDGMLPMCYPADHRDNVFIPNWAMWFTLETGEYLRRSGDRATVEMLRPRLEKLVAYLWRFRNSDGLLEKLPSWVFVEWSRCNKLVQDVSYPSNMTRADTLEAMSALYGRTDLAAEAARVRETVRRQSWNGEWFCDNAVRQKDGSLKLSGECTETCQYYAFFHRVASPASHPELWRRLMTDFGPKRYDPKDRTKMLAYPEISPSNAFIGNYLRLKLLEREGRGQQILDETKGYFQYMADRTGTLWENDTTCASCNHGFASYAAVLLVKSVLGAEIDLLAKTVTLRETDAKLDFASATLPVGKDEVTVTRRRSPEGQVTIDATVPPTWKVRR